MSAPRVTAIKLQAFKSFHSEVMPLDRATILTGRNSSGKSNALDAIEVLGRLAAGEDIGDALDGRRREGGAVRGGSVGCAPHGSDSFEIGCSVEAGGSTYEYQVEIQVVPDLKIIRERLLGPAPAVKSGTWARRELMITRPATHSGVGIEAEIFNGKRGNNPVVMFRDTRLILTQVPVRVSWRGNRAERAVLEGVDAVVTAIKGAFHLDPIPHLMRDYVPERDSELRRTGENLSAALARMSEDEPARFSRLVKLIRQVADERVDAMEVTRSPLGDVMLALRERRGEEGSDPEITPAREMSDGLLRFIAIATALLTPTGGLDIDGARGRAEGHQDSVLLVIEELENGLHPSQARRVLDLIMEASNRPDTSVVLTTHSPALLDAVEGRLMASVLVCFRDEVTGRSRISRVSDLPGYAEALAQGSLGESVTRGNLTGPETRSPDVSAFKRLLGIS